MRKDAIVLIESMSAPVLICLFFHAWLFLYFTRDSFCISCVALFVLVLEVEEDDSREESDDADVGEGGAGGSVVLIVLALLLFDDMAGGLEGGELFVDGEVVLQGHPLHGSAKKFSREEGGRSHARQAGGHDLGDAHLED